MGRTRLKRRGYALLLAAGVLATAHTTGMASASEASAYAGAEQHFAGSQIAEHEGRDHGTPQRSGSRTLGNDVSGWQGDVDWEETKRKGARFSYAKATEGTGYTNPHFTQQYDGAYRVGLIRGAYHFARPDLSSGSAQAAYFVRNGGGWSDDGKTLPGALDIEYNPNGEACYGMNDKQMSDWIADFVRTYESRTGRAPAIYTSTSWWRKCTGNNASFGSDSPLWIARYSDSVGELPAGWPTHTIWQYSDSGELPGDQNYFNGSEKQLRRLAQG